MKWRKRSVVAVTFFAVGFLVGAYYGGFIAGLLPASVVSFIAGLGFGQVTDWVGLLREWYGRNREDKMEKRIAWKYRILTVLDAYIGSLVTIGCTAIVVPVGEIINDYGWPEVNHKKEAQKFMEQIEIYRAWKKAVEKWHEYYETSREEQKKENPSKIDGKFRSKIITELSRSELPSGSRHGEGEVINKRYANYDQLVSIVMLLWKKVPHSYNVEFLVKEGYANSSDGTELDKLVSIISNLESSEMKVEYEDAIKQSEEKSAVLNQTRYHEWTNLLAKRDEFVSRLRNVRDDVEAERVDSKGDAL